MSKGRSALLFASLLFASVQIPGAANAEPWFPFFSSARPAQPVESVAPAPAPMAATARRQRVAVVAPEFRPQPRPPIIIGIGF